MNCESRIPIDREKIAAFCQKWKIVEFSLFGSVLRDDFRPDSDVDVMVEFAESAKWRMADWFEMEDDLRTILGREVDMIVRSDVERMENYIRRKSILDGAASYYAQ